MTGLSPGSRYNLEVSARRLGYVDQPSSVEATTSGEELPDVNDLRASVVKGDITAIKLEWNPPKDKRKLKWEYGIYYGVNLEVRQGVAFGRLSGHVRVVVNNFVNTGTLRGLTIFLFCFCGVGNVPKRSS